METMTEDKLEGMGLPAHVLVFLDVSWVLALLSVSKPADLG